jgi:hypothetical protein
MDKRLEQLVEKLKKAYGERLVSVVLYGSAAAGDHHAGFSDFNILCVLSVLTPRELAASASRSAGGASRAARRRCCSPNTSWPLPPIASPSSSTTCKAITGCSSAKTSFRRWWWKTRSTARKWSTTCAPSCCGCARRLPECWPTPTCCAACCSIRFPRFACSSATRCLLHGVAGAHRKNARSCAWRTSASASIRRRSKNCWMCARSASSPEMDPLAVLAAYLRAIDTVIDAVDRLEK